MDIDAMIFAINNKKCFWFHHKYFLYKDVSQNLCDAEFNNCMKKLSQIVVFNINGIHFDESDIDCYSSTEINYFVNISLNHTKNEVGIFLVEQNKRICK